MTRPSILAVAAGVLIFAGVGMRVRGLADRRTRTVQADDPIVNVMKQLRSDLGSATVTMPGDPGGGPRGYLHYVEGPRSDATVAANDRGDSDDLLAMTAAAAEGASFSGIAPWGVLEAARAISLGPAYTAPAGYDPAAPRSFEGEVAEVVYWIAPTGEAGDDTSSHRQLHRRAFLIRPELNVTSARLAAAGYNHEGFAELSDDQPVLGYLRADGVIQPYGDAPMDLSVAPAATHNDPRGSVSSRFFAANSLATLADSDRRVVRQTPAERRSGKNRFDSIDLQPQGVIAANILAFDVQVLDPGAPIFVGVGVDGEPGTAGVDDNGNGIVDHQPDEPIEKDRGEFGAIGSDDPIVTPSGAAFFSLVRRDASASVAISRGVFVDNGYAIGAGGNVRLGFEDPDAGNVRQEYFSLLSSPFSGVSVRGTTARPRLTSQGEPGLLSIGGATGTDERVTLKIVVRYQSIATDEVHQVEAIGEF
jgi:hypothetical protein